MSKLRTARQVTKSDRKSSRTLKAGLLIHDGRTRFITLTDATMKKFRSLKRWFGSKMVEYFGVLTGEGKGVIHLVYCGVGVRYSDLKRKWFEITGGSWNCSISKVRSIQGIMQELLLQHRKIRYFHSLHWAVAKKTTQSDLFNGLLPAFYREKGKRGYFLK